MAGVAEAGGSIITMSAPSQFTAEFAQRVRHFFAEMGVIGPDVDVIANAARHWRVAFIDPDRQRALIDERVYAGACFRVGHFQRLADAYRRPRLPSADVWRFISGGLE
jgi:hypothetical protein